MSFELAPLPFETDALEPYMSKRTIEYHYGKHHKGYVKKLNALLQGTAIESDNLEEIVLFSKDRMPEIYNNAAQVWNHTFFWNGLAKNPEGPSQSLELRLTRDFGSIERFKSQFCSSCKTLFGSGWVWLVLDPAGHLEIRALGNAGNPLVRGEVPLLTCDVWEHAYYLDYQNERAKYVENFWHVVNWEAIEKILDQSTQKIASRRAPQRPSDQLSM